MIFTQYIQLDFISFIVEIFLFILSIVLLLFGVFLVSFRGYKYVNFVIELKRLLMLVIFFALLILYATPVSNQVFFNNLLVIDPLVLSVKFILLLTTFCAVGISFNYLKYERISLFEYNILILLGLLGLICFISAHDLVSFYLALELQSLSFYILASFKKDSAFSTEAGLKYFILGALSSGFLLFGIALIYGSVGSTNFEIIFKSVCFIDGFSDSFSLRVILGSIFLLIGLLFKLTAAPFHMWAPDVYEGAPTPISALFAAVPKLGLFLIGIKIFYVLFYDLIFFWQNAVLFCALTSILVGTFSALRQTKIKRFLAFSSVTHVGFLLISFSTGTLEGISSLFFYMFIYIIMTLNVWSIVLFLEYRKKGSRLRYITDLQNLSKSHPLIAFTLAMNLFSMSGVPPLAGFFSKMYVFFSGLEVSLNFIVIIGIIVSVISSFYYLRFIKLMYFDGINQGYSFISKDSDNFLVYLLGITFLVIVFLFINPNFLILFTESLGVFLFGVI